MIEKGETKLTIDRLEKLANLYKMDITDLIKLSEQVYIHSMTNNQGLYQGYSQNVTLHNVLKDEERQLYQSTIDRLTAENERLVKLVEKLMEKL